jgi:hypothetical protein
MPVLAKINGQKAILRSGEWRSADPRTERILNAATNAWIQRTGGPPLTDADPERRVAEHIVPSLGGRILLRVRAKSDLRHIYLNRRQLDLFPGNGD